MSSRLAELKPTTDAELVARTLEGQEKAFRELVQRYNGLVYNVIFRLTNNRELSEELTQEAFLKVYRNLHSYDPTRAFRPWLLRIASNTTLSELRKMNRQQTTSLTELEESGFSPENALPAGQTDRDEVSAALERADAGKVVLDALEKLDHRYKQALLLRYQHELSYEEVADTLEVPLNTVRTWLRRGLEKLRNEVKELAL